ncbi:MAG: beta-lactamase family protein [Planctomycetes bacterium]|nr:beta-lactamase family protein [Planctomycetota bacterium]
MRHRSVLVLVLATATTTSIAQDPAWAARVDALVQKRITEPDAVGFSVGIAQQGKVLLAKGYGFADLESDAPANGETMFRIGSVTKQFTATLVLRAVEKGLLTLDDPLDRFVDFPLQGKVVTIRHLLNHSSGIPSYTDLGEVWEKTTPLDIGQKELLALVAGKPFEFEPGKGFAYNNTGYFLLGMVLEKLHGKPYAQLVRDELCTPLGLHRTRYDSNQDLIKNRAQGYALVDGKPANDALLSPNHPYAAGSLLSTGGDLVRWSMALAGGKVVSAANYTAMTTPLVVDGRDTHYGFGLMTGSVAELPTVMHGGGIHGFNSFLLHVPQHDLHVAVISNGEHANSQKLAGAIVRVVLDIAEFVAKDLALPATQRDGMVGVYDFPEVGMALHVTAMGEKLQAKGDAEGQEAFSLLFQGGREFRASFDHAVKLEWSEDGKSIQLHQGGRVAAGKRR